ncbi:ATP-binding protein [Bradyrhizobium sp.]|uniref:ATP-binding protein n=1 Tax=Bradyrhizobium sp. TaxID=376 RepID=UPI004037D9E4
MHRLNRRWKRQAFWQAMTGALLAGSILFLFLFDLRLRYDATIEQGKRSAENFAEVLSEHTALTFENVERTLREVAKIRSDALHAHYVTADESNAALRLLMNTSPIVVAVGWTDAAGNLIAHSYDRPAPRTNVSGMDHFKVQRDRTEDRLYVSPPFLSAANGKWLTAASLRLSDADGSFAGIVTAPLDQSYFAKLYRSIDLGTEGSILLMHTGGLVLAREPFVEDVVGRSFAHAPLLTQYLPKSDSGAYETISVLDGRPRIAGYKAVRGLPLVMLVTYARADLLRPWYNHITLFGPVVAIVFAAMLIGTFLLVQQTRRLARNSRELERTNTRFDIALSHMPHGLIVWDADERIVIANSRFHQMYGLAPEQVKPGTSLRQLLDSQAANGQNLGPNGDGFISRIVSEAMQTHVLADGRTVAMRRRPTPEGGWIAAHEDISEQMRIEGELREAKDRAEAAARATADFLSNMTHELRTPLTAIIGVSDMLLSGEQSRDRQRQYLQMQRSAGQGLLGIVNDILDFSKIEAGQFTLSPGPLSLSRLTQECLAMFWCQALRKGVDVTSHIASDVPDWVWGDAVRLRQILVNLLGNAVKFTPSGSVRLTVDLVPGSIGALRFAVTDTGIGIAPRDLPSLFERFVQAENTATRRVGGSGLGLAISRQLVNLMGGKIDVASAPGRGSEFSFVVELALCEAASPETSRASLASGTSYRLLLAEDYEPNCDLIKAMLEQAGHEVVTANNGAEAVRMAVRSSFDAILLDVQMPQMDGYAAARTIRTAIGGRPRLPIIALTANALPGESERCLEAGMDVHVPKPVNWPDLFETIDRLVREERRAETGPSGGADPLAEPDASSPSPAFDEATLAQLRKSIGHANAGRLLHLFSVEARVRFLTPPETAEDRDAICREAHTLGGAAGMLGFQQLSDACRNLEGARPDLFDACLGRCREARDAALRIVAGLLAEEEPVQAERTTA